MSFFDDKIIHNVRWSSPAQDTVFVYYSDSEEDKVQREYPLGMQDLNHPDVLSLTRAGWSLERIAKETSWFLQAQRDEIVMSIDNDQKAEILRLRKELEERGPAAFVSVINTLIESNENTEMVFKTKLEIFDLIKDNKKVTAAQKTKIRTANTLLPLLGEFIKIYEKLETK